MNGADTPADQKPEMIRLIKELESALVEYVERFGPTEKASQALRTSSIWHAGIPDEAAVTGGCAQGQPTVS